MSPSRSASATMTAVLRQFSIHRMRRRHTAPANQYRKSHPGFIAIALALARAPSLPLALNQSLKEFQRRQSRKSSTSESHGHGVPSGVLGHGTQNALASGEVCTAIHSTQLINHKHQPTLQRNGECVSRKPTRRSEVGDTESAHGRNSTRGVGNSGRLWRPRLSHD